MYDSEQGTEMEFEVTEDEFVGGNDTDDGSDVGNQPKGVDK